MIRDFELGYFNGSEYETKVYAKAHELLSMQGSFTTKDETIIHIHVTAGDKDHSVKGGHLIKGTVNVLNELSIISVQDIQMSREFNPDTGLKELRVG